MSKMQVLDTTITINELKIMVENSSRNFVKAVVDIDQDLVAIDAELHSVLRALLIEGGSDQENLWGINLYPDLTGDDFIEFKSMINLRPYQNNMSRSVDDDSTRKKIIQVVEKWVTLKIFNTIFA